MGVARADRLGLVVRSTGLEAGEVILKDCASQSALPLAIQEREQPVAYPSGEVW